MKILVVEDQAVAASVLMATLRSLGHEPELATGGLDAWTRVKAGGYRVVISDWMMPEFDGLELCHRIRELGGNYVYFILVSSNLQSVRNRQLALVAGVDDFLSKPILDDELGMRLHVAERILKFTTQIQQLETFLPVCGYCRKVRDDKNYWQQIEQYIKTRTGTKMSHGVCPECYDRELVPQMLAAGVTPPPYVARDE